MSQTEEEKAKAAAWREEQEIVGVLCEAQDWASVGNYIELHRNYLGFEHEHERMKDGKVVCWCNPVLFSSDGVIDYKEAVAVMKPAVARGNRYDDEDDFINSRRRDIVVLLKTKEPK